MCKESVTFCSSVTALNFLISLPTLKSQECKTSQSNRHLAACNLINFLFKTIFLNSQSSNPSTFSTFTVLGCEGPSGVLWEPSSVPGPCRSLSDGAPVHQVILCTAPQPGHPASVWGSALVCSVRSLGPCLRPHLGSHFHPLPPCRAAPGRLPRFCSRELLPAHLPEHPRGLPWASFWGPSVPPGSLGRRRSREILDR